MKTENHTNLKATEFGPGFYQELCQKAASDPRLRSHYNIHDDLNEPCQRLIVAIQPNSYVRPHRHLIDPKPETIFCLNGSVGVIIFDNSGEPSQLLRLSPGGASNGCNIPAGAWHSIVSLQKDSVFLETKPGPYVPFQPDDFASWAPAESFEDYASSLKSLFAAT